MNNTCSSAKKIPFNNKSALEDRINSDSNFSSTLTAAIHISDNVIGTEERKDLPRDIEVTIRLPYKDYWKTDILYPRYETYDDTGIFDAAFTTFLSYQLWFFSLFVDPPLNLRIDIHSFPFPEWVHDSFLEDTGTLETRLTILISLAFILNYIVIIKTTVTEKEKQLKESMKVMGLPGWLQWLSWFLINITICIINIIIMLLIVNHISLPAFPYSDGFLLFIFFLLYASSVITFAFFLASLFSEANRAVIFGIIIFLLTSVPFSALSPYLGEGLSSSTILFTSLLPNTGLGFGIGIFLAFERTREGNLWGNLWEIRQPHNVSLSGIMTILLMESIMYLLLALYIDSIYPGTYGIPKPWYFPCMYFYRKKSSKTDVTDEESVLDDSENFEKLTENLPVGIQLVNLSKYFGNYPAVKNLNLNIYKGQITVLVGHNGAGKTTTMNLITGMFPPTRGKAIIDGYDVRTHVGKVRDSMGLCFEHNVLFDELSVREHLYFFAKLKGLNEKEINQEVDSYLEILELKDKKKAFPKSLSGGMKRKLCIAMAFCGKSKFVIFDEPTSGLDPSARRTVWNLLQREKKVTSD